VDVRTDGVHIGIPPQLCRANPTQGFNIGSRERISTRAAHRILLVKYRQSGRPNLIDKNFEWEKQYAYTVTPITWVETQPNGKRLHKQFRR